MGPIDLLLHFTGLLAPAAFLALVLPLAARIALRATAGRASWWWQTGSILACAAAVQIGGLWWFGADGRMATYAALIAVAATVQWLTLRAWR